MSDIEWLKLHVDNLVGDDPGYSEVEWAIAEIGRLTAENEAMAKHIEAVQITWDGCDSERMELRAKNERLTAFIADKIHDASRERMLMEIGGAGE